MTTRGRLLRIRHRTHIAYDGPATSSFNEVRMTPLTLPGQTAHEARVEVRPAAFASQYWDYWGSQVTAFDLQTPHDTLTITARSTVETSPPGPLPPPPSWKRIRRAADGHRLAEYGAATGLTEPGEEAAEAARGAVDGLDPHEAALAVAELVHGRVAYVPGATGVGTGAGEAWEKGAGVCQDIAHLTVGLLRGVGLPARYVSGYLHPEPDAPVHEDVEGQSHAWVEYWAGEWVGHDPTNATRAGESHVVVARGRDYTDVPPHKGVYRGAPGGPPEVDVTFTRLA